MEWIKYFCLGRLLIVKEECVFSLVQNDYSDLVVVVKNEAWIIMTKGGAHHNYGVYTSTFEWITTWNERMYLCCAVVSTIWSGGFVTRHLCHSLINLLTTWLYEHVTQQLYFKWSHFEVRGKMKPTCYNQNDWRLTKFWNLAKYYQLRFVSILNFVVFLFQVRIVISN